MDLTQDDIASEEPFDEAIRDQDVLYGTHQAAAFQVSVFRVGVVVSRG